MSSRSIPSDAYDPDGEAYATVDRTAHLDAADLTFNPSPSDSTLITQLCGQDAQALGVLYDRYGTLIYTLALRMTGNRTAAEAVSMDVFQTCWHSADTFRGGDVAGWLIGMTRQHALCASGDQVSTSTEMRKRRQTPVDNKFTGGNADGRTMRAALSALPTEQREAIELAYYSGLSSTTIAVRLGEPLSVIKTYLRCGLQALHMHIRVGAKEPD